MPRGVIPRQPAKSGRQERAGAGRQRRPVAQVGRSLGSQQGSLATGHPGGRKKPVKANATKAGKAPKGYNPVAPERIAEILERLDARYPAATCALHHHSAWELLVATILSAQSTDARVNMVTPGLFRKYPTIQDFAALKPEQLEPDLYSTGFYRNKSKAVIGAAKKILSDFAGQVPSDMDSLLKLPGVARKTANVVLGTWFGKNEGVVVDTHVYRISHRLELSQQQAPEKVEQDLMKAIPRDKWTLFSHQIILHGRALCVARKPKCVDCPLENLCHAADKTWSTVEIHKDAKP